MERKKGRREGRRKKRGGAEIVGKGTLATNTHVHIGTCSAPPHTHTDGWSSVKNSAGGVPNTCVTMFHWSISDGQSQGSQTFGGCLVVRCLVVRWLSTGLRPRF